MDLFLTEGTWHQPGWPLGPSIPSHSISKGGFGLTAQADGNSRRGPAWLPSIAPRCSNPKISIMWFGGQAVPWQHMARNYSCKFPLPFVSNWVRIKWLFSQPGSVFVFCLPLSTLFTIKFVWQHAAQHVYSATTRQGVKPDLLFSVKELHEAPDFLTGSSHNPSPPWIIQPGPPGHSMISIVMVFGRKLRCIS